MAILAMQESPLATFVKHTLNLMPYRVLRCVCHSLMRNLGTHPPFRARDADHADGGRVHLRFSHIYRALV